MIDTLCISHQQKLLYCLKDANEQRAAWLFCKVLNVPLWIEGLFWHVNLSVGLNPDVDQILEVAVLITDGELSGPHLEVNAPSSRGMRHTCCALDAWHLSAIQYNQIFTCVAMDYDFLQCLLQGYRGLLDVLLKALSQSCSISFTILMLVWCLTMVAIALNDMLSLAQGPELIIHQPDEVLGNMNEWCIKTHGKNGLTQKCKESKISLQNAESKVCFCLC